MSFIQKFHCPTRDSRPDPNVSFIQRFHCTIRDSRPDPIWYIFSCPYIGGSFIGGSLHIALAGNFSQKIKFSFHSMKMILL